ERQAAGRYEQLGSSWGETLVKIGCGLSGEASGRFLQRVDEPARKAGDYGDPEIQQSQRDSELRRYSDWTEQQNVEGFSYAETVDAHRHHAGEGNERHEDGDGGERYRQ